MLKHVQLFNRNTGPDDQGTMFLTTGIFLNTEMIRMDSGMITNGAPSLYNMERVSIGKR